MLTVFEPSTQATVQVTGIAREIKDGFVMSEIAQRALVTSMQTSDAGIPPLTKLDAGESVGFEIEPIEVSMAVYARPDPGSYQEMFETLGSDELSLEDK